MYEFFSLWRVPAHVDHEYSSVHAIGTGVDAEFPQVQLLLPPILVY